MNNDEGYFVALRRKVRIISILEGAEDAGLTPLAVIRLHNVAFLANVLAPVWQVHAIEGRVLKRQGGPFYPALQHDLDRLIGIGVVAVHDVHHVVDESGRWRLEGFYQLNRAFATPILDAVNVFAEEALQARYVREIAFAVSSLSDEELDHLAQQDATYGDSLVDVGNVVDFAEWRTVNYASNAANMAGRLMVGGTRATPGEKLHMYVRHLQKRLQRAK